MEANQFVRLCGGGDLEAVRDAVQSGADVNGQDTGRGYTGLMEALVRGHTAVATFLLQQENLDVDITNFSGSGWSALHWASTHDEYTDCLALILTKTDGRAINMANQGIGALLHIAILNGARRNIERLLTDNRIDCNIRNLDGLSPLMLAVCRNFRPAVELLLADNRVDLLTRDEYRRSEEERIR